MNVISNWQNWNNNNIFKWKNIELFSSDNSAKSNSESLQWAKTNSVIISEYEYELNINCKSQNNTMKQWRSNNTEWHDSIVYIRRRSWIESRYIQNAYYVVNAHNAAMCYAITRSTGDRAMGPTDNRNLPNRQPKTHNSRPARQR